MRGLLLALLLLPSQARGADAIDLVRVYKKERTMQLLARGKVLHTFHIALGDSPVGHKQREGDEKTPEGRYVLDYANPGSQYYKSLHISYPNAKDKAAAKKAGVSPGGMIMIHGQKNGYGHLAALTQKVDWTDGCLALSNEDMDTVWSQVRVGTPIEIAPGRTAK